MVTALSTLVMVGVVLIVACARGARQTSRHSQSRGRLAWVGVSLGLVLVVVAVSLLLLWELPRFQLDGLCRAHLRMIWEALAAYQARSGMYPPSLEVLIGEGLLLDVCLQCPFEELRAPSRSDYVYVTGITENDPPAWPLVFDREGNHENHTRNVVCVDGSVRHLREHVFKEELARFMEEYENAYGHPPLIE